MRATFEGQVLAESGSTVVVEGNHYFPPASVDWELLEASDTRTTCPWKGVASYWSVAGAGPSGRDVAWAYPDPKAAAVEIAGHVAFWRGVVIEP
ncbi:DUF427 domain-containing protein [Cellulomonas phragmiteti]|uniref:DUF427 domain-containing protein n=1 Tax=Cellulomonas phragmiteti TaxID=478780 RepID=A0ABQ4DQD2_9CELL|nr:DUF427 domain-containing protein [Cellulomonas phragmiteti]GIG41561.1 hypothetical protein Cph01nite_33230 [Cellulomonas phragmiteti]